MAFVQRDVKNGVTQQLFLLRSRHDLELECRIVDRRGKAIGESVRLAFTLDDKLSNQLDRHPRNSVESYAAWRSVIASCIDGHPEALRTSVSRLVGIAAIAMFGEPTWQIDDELIPANSKMLHLIRVHHEKVR